MTLRAVETDQAYALAGPAESAQERLVEECGLRLAQITTANGYAYTLAKLARASLDPFKGDDVPACNYWLGPDEFVSAGAGYVERTLTLFVEVWARTRDEPFTDLAYRIALAPQIALKRSTSRPTRTAANDSTLGGMAQRVECTSITPQLAQGQAPWCGALLTFAIAYRVRRDDPTVFV